MRRQTMRNVSISKLYEGGLPVQKPKVVVKVECFCMDVNKGSNSFGVCIGSTGQREAMALHDKGMMYSELPTLYRAEVLGFYAQGFLVAGVCDEMIAKKVRKVYCEWFVSYPEEMRAYKEEKGG